MRAVVSFVAVSLKTNLVNPLWQISDRPRPSRLTRTRLSVERSCRLTPYSPTELP
jgi:hypothetical protein